MEKVIREIGKDGKEKIFAYDSEEGYLFIKCSAYDLRNAYFVGNYKEPDAQELLNEL